MDGRQLEMVNQPSDPAVPRQQLCSSATTFSRRRATLFSTTYASRTRSSASQYQLLSIVIFSIC